MTDLARAAVVAIDEAAADDDPSADAVGDVDDEHRALTGSTVEGPFGDRGRLRVVHHADRESDPPIQSFLQCEVPPVEPDRPAHDPAARVDDASGADADPEERTLGAPDQQRHERLEVAERRLPVATVQGAGPAPHDLPAQVDDDAAQLLAVHVHADEVTSAVGDAQQDRGLATGRGPDPGLRGEAVDDEVVDDVRDGRASEPGRARDVGAADRAALVDRAEHEALVRPPSRLMGRPFHADGASLVRSSGAMIAARRPTLSRAFTKSGSHGQRGRERGSRSRVREPVADVERGRREPDASQRVRSSR